MNLRLNEAIVTKTKKGRYEAKLGIKGGTQSKRCDSKKGAIFWLRLISGDYEIQITYKNC